MQALLCTRLAVTAIAMAALTACGTGSLNTASSPTPKTLELAKIGGFAHQGGESSAEITAYDPLSKRLFVVNGALASLDVLDLSNPADPKLITTVPASRFGAELGGINSVAVHQGVVALAVEAKTKTNPGLVAWLRASDLQLLGTDTVGALPDMLTFTPDGRHLLVANEGEPSSYGQADSVDPEGSVSIIAVRGLSPTTRELQRQVFTAGFTAYNSQADALRKSGVRVFGPGASVAQDLEPEYIAVSADSKTAWVTLQENNAVAVVDIAARRVSAIRPLGFKDHSRSGMGMDVSDEDGVMNSNNGKPVIKIAPVPVKGLYMPDAIASYTVGGQTYLVTANEGDAREYKGFNEETRVREYCKAGLAASAFADPVNQIMDSNLGRLRVTLAPNGGVNGKNAAGECAELYSFGARSISIWSSDMTLMADTGDTIEQKTIVLPNAEFNASHGDNKLDSRSTSKGPEPEGVVVGTFGERSFAFVGLERVGGVMVFDVTNPKAPRYVNYLNTRDGAKGGDRGPEGLTLIAASDSPNGQPLLVVGNEASGTTAILQIKLGY